MFILHSKSVHKDDSRIYGDNISNFNFGGVHWMQYMPRNAFLLRKLVLKREPLFCDRYLPQKLTWMYHVSIWAYSRYLLKENYNQWVLFIYLFIILLSYVGSWTWVMVFEATTLSLSYIPNQGIEFWLNSYDFYIL